MGLPITSCQRIPGFRGIMEVSWDRCGQPGMAGGILSARQAFVTSAPPAGCHRGRRWICGAVRGCVGSWRSRPHPDREPDDRSNVRGPPAPSGEGAGSEAHEKNNRSNPHPPHSFHQNPANPPDPVRRGKNAPDGRFWGPRRLAATRHSCFGGDRLNDTTQSLNPGLVLLSPVSIDPYLASSPFQWRRNRHRPDHKHTPPPQLKSCRFPPLRVSWVRSDSFTGTALIPRSVPGRPGTVGSRAWVVFPAVSL